MANIADYNLDPKYPCWILRYTELPNGETIKEYVRYSEPCFTVKEQREQLKWYFHVNNNVIHAVGRYIPRIAQETNILFPCKVNQYGTLVYAFQPKLWKMFWNDCQHNQKRLPKVLKKALIRRRKEKEAE